VRDIRFLGQGACLLLQNPLLGFGRSMQLAHSLSLFTRGSRVVASSGEQLLHVLRLSLAEPTKPLSGTPEREGEQCDDRRRQGDNGPVILVGELASACVDKAEARPLPYDVGLDNANTFVKGLILVAILAGMYAIGKRLGIID
jgi:hypothetical protein